MFTHIEYLEVVATHFGGSMKDSRRFQALTVKIPRSDTKFYIQISNRIKLPHLRRGDKIRIILDFYVCGRSKKPQWTVRDLILIHDIESESVTQKNV